jgi:hypothetical protein
VTKLLSAGLLLEEIGIVLLVLSGEAEFCGGVLVLVLLSALDRLGGTELASVLVPGPCGEDRDLDEQGKTNPEGHSGVGGVGDSGLDRSRGIQKVSSVGLVALKKWLTVGLRLRKRPSPASQLLVGCVAPIQRFQLRR